MHPVKPTFDIAAEFYFPLDENWRILYHGGLWYLEKIHPGGWMLALSRPYKHKESAKALYKRIQKVQAEGQEDAQVTDAG